ASRELAATESSEGDTEVPYAEADAEGADAEEDRSLRDYRFDADYLLYGLSYNAVPDLVKFTDTYDNVLSENIKASLLEIYEYELKDYRADNWKKFNISRERARIAIEGMIERNLMD
ncbi:MAG: hypothetical protein ACYC5K_12880, partial [Saccharofermentanales bacterium]